MMFSTYTYGLLLAILAKTTSATFSWNDTSSIVSFANSQLVNSTIFAKLPQDCQAAYYNPIDCDAQLTSINPLLSNDTWSLFQNLFDSDLDTETTQAQSIYAGICSDVCQTSVATWAQNFVSTCGSALNDPSLITGYNTTTTVHNAVNYADFFFHAVYSTSCFADTDGQYCPVKYPDFSTGATYFLWESEAFVANLSTNETSRWHPSFADVCGNYCFVQYVGVLNLPGAQVPFGNDSTQPIDKICSNFTLSNYTLLQSAATFAAKNNSNSTNSTKPHSSASRSQGTGSLNSILLTTSLLVVVFTFLSF